MADETDCDPIRFCVMCEKEGRQTCTGCHAIHYCSKECQKLDWPLHKLLCKTFPDFNDSSRPKEDGAVYRRANLFSENEDNPRWFWLCVFASPETRDAIPDLFRPPFEQPLVSVDDVQRNMVLQRFLSPAIILSGEPGALSKVQDDTSGQKNKSLLKIDEELFEWIRGSIFAGGVNPYAFDRLTGMAIMTWEDQVCDLTPIDLRHSVDHMRVKYDQTGKSYDIFTKSDAEKVKGARISCMGDQVALKHFLFDSFIVNKSLCDGASELDLRIGDKIGVPLVARRLPHSLCWRDRIIDNVAFGESSLAMRLQVQKQWEGIKGITDPAVGKLTRSRLSDREGKEGTCVMVRKDGKPLDPKFLEALSDYATKILLEAENLAMDLGVWKEDVLEGVTKGDWQKYYNKFVSHKKSPNAPISVFMPGVEGGYMPAPPGVPLSNPKPGSVP